MHDCTPRSSVYACCLDGGSYAADGTTGLFRTGAILGASLSTPARPIVLPSLADVAASTASPSNSTYLMGIVAVILLAWAVETS